MPSDADEYGIPRHGSALHLAYYVNCDPDALSEAIAGVHGTAPIKWRSPVADQRFIEFKDRDFLEAVGRCDLAGELARWWPASGPRWDALGVTSDGGVVLVEAKANVPEIANGPACGAGSSGSAKGLDNRAQIARALVATRVLRRLARCRVSVAGRPQLPVRQPLSAPLLLRAPRRSSATRPHLLHRRQNPPSHYR